MHIEDGALRRFRAPETFATRLAAEGWLAAERRLIDAGAWTSPKDRAAATQRSTITLGDFADQAISRRDLTPKTRSTYAALVESRIRPHLGDRVLASITVTDLADWWDAIGPQHRTTRAHAWDLVRSLLREAVDQGIIATSPAADPRFKRYGKRPRRSETPLLRPAEIDAVAAQLPAAYAVAVPLMAWCGLRFGELTELRLRDLVEEDGGLVLRIRRSAPLVDGVPVVREALKSDAGRRDVAVPPHVADQLRAHLAQRKRRRPDDFVVTTTRGGRLSQSAFTKSFKGALPPSAVGMRVHDLRHTGAVLAAQAGATTAEVMERLGHSTPEMALRYQHVAAGRQRAISQALSTLAALDHTPESEHSRRSTSLPNGNT